VVSHHLELIEKIQDRLLKQARPAAVKTEEFCCCDPRESGYICNRHLAEM